LMSSVSGAARIAVRVARPPRRAGVVVMIAPSYSSYSTYRAIDR
jgi:hypothetical protein